MDFQYEHPHKVDQNSPFRLAGLAKTLSFDAATTGNSLKRTSACVTSLTTGNWHDSPSKANTFSFNTPRTIPNTRGIFTPSNAPRFTQETPGTDNTEEATDDAVSEQDSPVGNIHRNNHKRSKLSDLAKLKIRRRRQKHIKDLQIDGSDEDDTQLETTGDRPWTMNHHRDLPYIASGYLQLFFNLFLLSVLLYFLVSFIMTIQADVNKKVEEYSAEILAEISTCSKDYLENRCSPDQRVPAMQLACQAWERCMERDPAKVGRARVSAETFAEIVNSLIEPISYKTMVFCLVLVFGSLFVSNAAFSVLRQKHSPSSHLLNGSSAAQPATFMIQATPQVGSRHKSVTW